ncbi:MAG: DNA polymerase IV [Patescibacteria group bacterium]
MAISRQNRGSTPNQTFNQAQNLNRTILHIDFDSFFASVEQQHDPSLRGRPMGVTATNGRTCIIASSREAKKLGIGTASRTYEALKICPQLKLVPADFDKYYEVSRKFLNICKDYSPAVELFSIDEVFMDITSTIHLFGGTYGLISKIKQRIKDEIGEFITASIGISHNKLLAKMASGLNKPDGIFEIRRDELDKVYSQVSMMAVCGIGERIKDRLNKIGVYSLLDLRGIDYPLLLSEFGNEEAKFLRNVSIGFDDSDVIPYTEAPQVKSVGRNYCLPKNEYDKRVILQNVYELWEEICIKLRRLNKKARTLGFSLRGNINVRNRKTYNFYFDDSQEIFNLFRALIIEDEEIFNLKENYIRQISVWVSSLEENSNLTLSLFDDTKKDNLTQAVDKINDRFGDHTIRNGFLLYSEKLTTKPNGYMADKYERIKLADESTAQLVSSE